MLIPTIDRFEGVNWFLSNFYPASLRVPWDTRRYPTSEHAYQAAKYSTKEMRDRIAAAPSPGLAKRLGQQPGIRDDWELVKVDIMRVVVQQKFIQNIELGDMLVMTEDAILIEGNTWGDMFWGVVDGKGLNVLGNLLMETRKFLTEDLANMGVTVAQLKQQYRVPVERLGYQLYNK